MVSEPDDRDNNMANTAGTSSPSLDQIDEPNPAVVDLDSEEEEDLAIPNSLKFLLDSLKTVSSTPLTSDNYLVWTAQVETIFQASGYEKYLYATTKPPALHILGKDGSKSTNPKFRKWNLINRSLTAGLVATISPSIQPFVLRQGSVADLWTSLKLRLQSTSKSRINQLKEELHNLRMRGETMNQYLTIVKNIVDQLEAAGSHVEDDDVMFYIMNGLPTTYNAFKVGMRIKDTPTNLNSFYSLLQSEEINIQREMKLQSPSPNAALAADRGRPQQGRSDFKGKGKQGSKPWNRNRPPNGAPNSHQQPSSTAGQQGPQQPAVTCQICKKLGHAADRCWYRYEQSGPSSSAKSAYMSDN